MARLLAVASSQEHLHGYPRLASPELGRTLKTKREAVCV